MSALVIGYARVSINAQDLTAQRDALEALGVAAERITLEKIALTEGPFLTGPPHPRRTRTR